MAPNEYELLDSGGGRKLERFGSVVLARPCAQAVWAPRRPGLWSGATASFDREEGLNWTGRSRLPASWVVPINGIRMKLSATDFGHLGVFPETRAIWDRITDSLSAARREKNGAPRMLNLFAYSGGATLAAARAGAEACHLDAARGMVDWARENAALNGLESAPVRWIVDDARKFLGREARRGRRYDAIILDPPSYGRGSHGEAYKIERDLPDTLKECAAVLSDSPVFVILTSHTPGFSPGVLSNLLLETFGKGRIEGGEMFLTGGPGVLPLPNGSWAEWRPR